MYLNGTSLVARITAGGNTNNVDISTSFSLYTWVNAVVTYDGGTVSLYKNGTLAYSVGKSGLMTNTMQAPFLIGGQWNGNGGYNAPSNGFVGYIGSVLLYDRALNSTEVAKNFNAVRTIYGL